MPPSDMGEWLKPHLPVLTLLCQLLYASPCSVSLSHNFKLLCYVIPVCFSPRDLPPLTFILFLLSTGHTEHARGSLMNFGFLGPWGSSTAG